MVVSLDLQHIGHAIAEIVIELVAGSEYLSLGIEELATETLIAHLGDDESRTQFVPVKGRA